jgi:hypothetical protein
MLRQFHCADSSSQQEHPSSRQEPYFQRPLTTSHQGDRRLMDKRPIAVVFEDALNAVILTDGQFGSLRVS